METSRQTNQPTDGHKEGHLGSLTSIEQEERGEGNGVELIGHLKRLFLYGWRID